MHGQETIVRYLQDAEAAERSFEDALASLSKTSDQPVVQSALTIMSQKAGTQHERLEARIQALSATRSTAKSALAHLLGLAPMPGESTQGLMITVAGAAAGLAMYEALASAATAAGDATTEQLARQLQDEEREDYIQAAALVRQSAIDSFEQAMREKAN
jgi:ferritin-like metal-binding protein YciE